MPETETTKATTLLEALTLIGEKLETNTPGDEPMSVAWHMSTLIVAVNNVEDAVKDAAIDIRISIDRLTQAIRDRD